MRVLCKNQQRITPSYSLFLFLKLPPPSSAGDYWYNLVYQWDSVSNKVHAAAAWEYGHAELEHFDCCSCGWSNGHSHTGFGLDQTTQNQMGAACKTDHRLDSDANPWLGHHQSELHLWARQPHFEAYTSTVDVSCLHLFLLRRLVDFKAARREDAPWWDLQFVWHPDLHALHRDFSGSAWSIQLSKKSRWIDFHGFQPRGHLLQFKWTHCFGGAGQHWHRLLSYVNPHLGSLYHHKIPL